MIDPYHRNGAPFLTESSKSPASIANIRLTSCLSQLRILSLR